MMAWLEYIPQIQRPMNMATDYLFGIFVLFWGHRLFWRWSQNFSKVTTRFWGLLFLFAGLAALTGGTVHGFQGIMDEELRQKLWRATLILLVCATYLLFLTGVKSFSHPRWQRILFVVGLFIFGFMVFLVNKIPEFKFVIYYYAPILVTVLLLNYQMYSKYRRTSNKFATFGLLFLVISSLCQYYKIGLSPTFDHNDIYHVVSLFAFYLLYIGARHSKDHLGD